MQQYRLAVDIGGTFTDVVLGCTDSSCTSTKCPTTPGDPVIGAMAGIDEVLRMARLDLPQVGMLVHGTTLATNTLIKVRADSSQAEALALSYIDMRAVEAIDKLESTLGKPVVTSNQALMRSAVLRLAVAQACGCENVVECQAADTAEAVKAALASNQMTIIVCKCDPGNAAVPVIEIDPVVIRHRFMQEVKARNR